MWLNTASERDLGSRMGVAPACYRRMLLRGWACREAEPRICLAVRPLLPHWCIMAPSPFSDIVFREEGLAHVAML